MPVIDRRAIYARDGGLCGFCGQHVPMELMHLDHIQPKGLGGPTTMENLRVAHRVCNIAAGHKVVAERRRLGLPPDLVVIRLSGDLRRRALAVARAEDRTLTSLVVYALRRYLDAAERGEPKP